MSRHSFPTEPVAQGPVRPAVRAALILLHEAHQLAQEVNQDPWCFAVELEALRTAGSSLNALRWLVGKGHAAARLETTQPGAPQRSFRTITGLALHGRVAFVLTETGFQIFQQGASAAQSSSPSAPELAIPYSPVPHWDNQRRELYLGTVLVKRFRQPAQTQELILSAFEEEGWPPRIDDPLPLVPALAHKRHLHRVITNLNRNQRQHLLIFRGDGTGTGVCWEALDIRRTAPADQK